MAERVLTLTGDGRGAIAADELPPFEFVEAAFELPRILRRHDGQATEPEDLAEDGGVLEQSLGLRLEARRGGRR